MNSLENIYPRCYKILGGNAWRELFSEGNRPDAPDFPEFLTQKIQAGLVPYLADLAAIERAFWQINWSRSNRETPKCHCERSEAISMRVDEIASAIRLPRNDATGQINGRNKSLINIAQLMVNPDLELLHLSWQLADDFDKFLAEPVIPHLGEQYVLVWWDESRKSVQLRKAQGEDLLALKIVTENISFQAAAQANQVTVGTIKKIIRREIQQGVLLTPPSRIRRNPANFGAKLPIPEEALSAPVFSLQWHLTNVCEQNCKHCYDRYNYTPLSLSQSLKILADLDDFCRERWVDGHVGFTGGNPFFYPHFFELYQAASDYGFSTSVLGNPVKESLLEKMLAIQRPRFYQVSLEGLKDHNDQVRGQGHYEKALGFLNVLKKWGITSHVMLTLTGDNLDQVLPLAEQLRGWADFFTFNRLSRVGNGAGLNLPGQEDYERFLKSYKKAGSANPILTFKDNLFNILNYRDDGRLSGGCTGYGCGAAFNFLVVLPDGEVHACRKFPSPLGNLTRQKLAQIYDGAQADKYRTGCAACKACPIRHACGGCPAVSYGFGQDVFTRKDPFCFFECSPR